MGGFGFQMGGQPGKKYGLILPKKKAAASTAAPPPKSVFGQDDDDEEETDVNAIITSTSYQKQMMDKVEQSKEKVLAEDPSAYLYDEVYDEITAGRKAVKVKNELDKRSRKPKYMQQLLNAADTRKHEDALYLERKYLKEAQEDAENFGDKDKFVTAAYKEKLKEEKAWREEQKRIEEEERKNDVRKKGNMNDFYRNLLHENVSSASRGDAEEKAAMDALKEKQGAVEKLAEKEREEGEAKKKGGGGGEAPLKGGLNVLKKPKWVRDADAVIETEEDRKKKKMEEDKKAHIERMRQRQRETEEQLVQLKKEKEVEEKRQKEEEKQRLEEARKKRTDDSAAMSARDRYLQRKKAKLTK